MAWHPIARWCALLRQGALDAALVSVAGMAAATSRFDSDPQAQSRAEAEHLGDPLQGIPDTRAIPLGRRPLVLLHKKTTHAAQFQQGRHSEASCGWQLLLPPAEHQPLLWRQLQRLDLLPLRDCSAADFESWLQALLQGPHLLPSHLSLLEETPWREALLAAVPPPEPLEESLGLLVRQGEERLPAIKALNERLQERLLYGSWEMQSMD